MKDIPLTARLFLPLLFAAVSLAPLAGGGATASLYLDGTAVIKVVDNQRVLVAIDTGNEGHAPDGLIDHVFMFTGKTRLPLRTREFKGPAHLQFDGNCLVVFWKGRKELLQFVVENEVVPMVPTRPGATRIDDAIGLSHFTGFSGFKLTDLNQLRRSTTCDHVAGSCYEANGHSLQFPA